MSRRDESSGAAEFRIAGRSAAFALIMLVLVQVTSLSTARPALALTFLLWLGVLLGAARAILALWIGLFKRRHPY